MSKDENTITILLFSEDYAFSTKIAGTGFSGPVRVATHIKTKKLCAVKRYDKTSADPERVKHDGLEIKPDIFRVSHLV